MSRKSELYAQLARTFAELADLERECEAAPRSAAPVFVTVTG